MASDYRLRRPGLPPIGAAWLLLVAVLFSACAPEIAEETPVMPERGATLYVSATTGAAGGFGTSTKPMKTITEAMLFAVTGDSVRVMPGTYDAANGEAFPVPVTAGVTLIGDPATRGAGTLIRGAGAAAYGTAALAPQSGSTVTGFSIQTTGTTASDMAVELAEDGVNLVANTVTGAGGNGIHVFGTWNHTFLNNTISGNAWSGIAFVPNGVTSGTPSRVEGNTLTGNGWAVELTENSADLGGGAAGSLGSNAFSCNIHSDIKNNLLSAAPMQSNLWDHAPPSMSTLEGSDIHNTAGVTPDTTLAGSVALPCATMFVATTGSDANPGTAALPLRTITKAMTRVGAGDTVFVAPGTYDAAIGETFPIAVTAGARLQGDPATKGAGTTPTLIRGAGPTVYGTAAIEPLAGAAVTGFSIQTTGLGSSAMAVGLAKDGVSIVSNTITGADGNGIHGFGSSNNVIQDNVITGNLMSGIALVVAGGSTGSGNRVQGNILKGNGWGVELSADSADFGGGAVLSTGGNQFTCNTNADLLGNIATVIKIQANLWDHFPPSLSSERNGSDIRKNASFSLDTLSGGTVASPCKATYFVTTTGANSNLGTNVAPLRTITSATGGAGAGDTINVAPGTYDAAGGEVFPIAVPSGVSLIGDEANKGGGNSPTNIIGAGNVAPFGLDFFTSPLDPQVNSVIAGFTITTAGAAPPNAVMALILKQNTITLRNNIITGGLDSGLYVFGSSGHTITGNSMSGNSGPGMVFVNGASLSRIENNVFAFNSFGVEFDSDGGDLGGGPLGSVGGNQLYCNTGNDFWTNTGGTFFLANNQWDHNPPTTVPGASAPDIFNGSGATLDTAGATVVTTPCP
jgi:parallel beta-helix repeat protein